ncbi:MAG: DsbA family protein [Magnetospirillum sp. WYHS-4]
MSISRVLGALGALLILAAAQPAPAADPAFNPAQEKAVREIVRKYLMENPEIIIEAVETFKAKQEAEEEERVKKAVVERRSDLENDPDSPEAGNPKGDVTIVEFFDYNCGYCKRVVAMLQDYLKEDPKIRLVFKEYPVLGPASLVAARAAIAASRMEKGKYLAFHTALMSAKGPLTEERIFATAGESGIDVAKLRKAMEDPAVDKAIAKTRALGKELGITGTPTFVIGNAVIPGALPKPVLQDAVASTRKK